MLETSARLLKLLSLLQLRRDWTGADLADRLGVTARTVRSDIGKLRELGYPVEASPGATGGYRLGPGASLPPLLLDDDEAVAVAIGLHTAATGSVMGMAEAAVGALVKLEQVMPSRLRYRIDAFRRSTVTVTSAGPTADPAVLCVIAASCRDRERLRFDYRNHEGDATRRDVEPHRLVHAGRRWYLVAWDVQRRDWRTFRVDRVMPRIPTGPRFVPRPEPEGGYADLVDAARRTASWRCRAHVTCRAPADVVSRRLPGVVEVTPVDDESCTIAVGSDTPQELAAYLGMIGVDFEVHEPPELIEEVRRLGERYLRASPERVDSQDGTTARFR